MPDFSRIPDAMKSYCQWVVWRYEESDGDKPTKVPYSPRGYLASVTDPGTWGTFDECVTIATNYPNDVSGIGFVLTDNDPFAFIDLDAPKPNATDSEVAKIYARQELIFREFDSYAEKSPSGNGLHIIICGKLEAGRKRGSVEVYSSKRYMTMTGDVFRDAPIRDYSELLITLWEEMGPPPNAIAAGLGYEEAKEPDEKVIEVAVNAKNGEKFQDLYYDGNWQKYYPSQSEADFALIDILAYYSNSRDQIQRIFLNSKLGQREKSRAQYRINYMLNKCFDRKLPPVDIEGLQNAIRAALEKQTAAIRPTVAESVPVETVSTPMHISEDSPYSIPPGLVGMVAQWIHEQSPRPVPEIALAGAIGYVASIAGRAYNINGTGLNHYVLLLANTGAGKEAISTGINKLMREVVNVCPPAAELMGPSDLASGQALIKQLAKRPRFLSIVGEIGLKLQQMTGDRAAQHLIQLRKVLLDLYNKSGNGNVLLPTAYSDTDKNTPAILAPAYTLIGESTPERFWSALSEEMISEGFLPRLSIIEYRGVRVDYNEGHEHRTPGERLVRATADLCANALTLDAQNKVINVRITPDAAKVARDFDAWCTHEINAAQSEVTRGLWNRAHIKVLKLAAVIAVGCDFYNPNIDLTILSWAKRLVLTDINNVLKRFADGDVGAMATQDDVNQLKKATDAIQQYIVSDWNSLAGYKAGTAMMHEQRVIPYSYLHKRLSPITVFAKSRSGGTNAVKNTLATMIAKGDLKEIPRAEAERMYGNAGVCYMIANPAAFGF
jgi:hypothetical protein